MKEFDFLDYKDLFLNRLFLYLIRWDDVSSVLNKFIGIKESEM